MILTLESTSLKKMDESDSLWFSLQTRIGSGAPVLWAKYTNAYFKKIIITVLFGALYLSKCVQSCKHILKMCILTVLQNRKLYNDKKKGRTMRMF